MAETELKSCPFCGAAPEGKVLGDGVWMVTCSSAQSDSIHTIAVSAKSRSAVIAAWNRRPPDPAVAEEAVEAAKRVAAFDPTFPKYDEPTDNFVMDAQVVARTVLAKHTAKPVEEMVEAVKTAVESIDKEGAAIADTFNALLAKHTAKP